MTVFLTGATGVLGRRLVTDLVGRGHEVYGLCRDEAGERLVAERGGIPRRGDVLEPASLTGAMPPAETLIHAATAIPTATRPRRGDWELNNRVREQGLTNLIAADDGHLERVVFPSIVWVARPPAGGRFDETSERHPDLGSRGVAAVERHLESISDSTDIETTVLRFGLFYAHDAASTRQVAEGLRAGRLPSIGGGPLGRRDVPLAHVHADDAASAVAEALAAGVTGTYHVVDDEPVSFDQFLRELADLLDAPPPRLTLPGWLARWVIGRVSADLLSTPMVTNASAFRRDTGWEPAYPTVRDGLRAVLARWERDGLPGA